MKAVRLITILVAIVALTTLVVFGPRAPGDPRPVRIECEDGVANWLRPLITNPVEGEPQALLIRDGDLVEPNSDIFFDYHASDGLLLHLEATDWNIRLAGKNVAVEFAEDSARQWMKTATEAELAALRYVHLPDSLDEASRSELEKLAAANPRVGLGFESQTCLLEILPRFQPRLLHIGPEVDLRPTAASLKELRTLVMSAEDSASLDHLPALPHLRRLYLGSWSQKAGALPVHLSGLRLLTVIGGDATAGDVALRNAPAGLEELSLIVMDSVNVAPLAALRSLRTLDLEGSPTGGDLSSLAGLHNLRRMGLPLNTTQSQFEALVHAHPRLEFMQIANVDGVTDLTPLHELRNLEALVLGGQDEHLDALNGLTSLRFLGVASDDPDSSSVQRAKLRKMLPDALVVAVSPLSMCLGSGWTLLLLPMGALFWFLGDRSRRRVKRGARAT